MVMTEAKKRVAGRRFRLNTSVQFNHIRGYDNQGICCEAKDGEGKDIFHEKSLSHWLSASMICLYLGDGRAAEIVEQDKETTREMPQQPSTIDNPLVEEEKKMTKEQMMAYYGLSERELEEPFDEPIR